MRISRRPYVAWNATQFGLAEWTIMFICLPNSLDEFASLNWLGERFSRGVESGWARCAFRTIPGHGRDAPSGQHPRAAGLVLMSPVGIERWGPQFDRPSAQHEQKG
jgi:hypothetical protein